MPKRAGKGAHRNAGMIARLRTEWRKLQRRRPREVSLGHVRSHVKTPGNEIADWLAACGADEYKISVNQAKRWVDRWLRRELQERDDRADSRDASRGPPSPPPLAEDDSSDG